VGTITSTKTDEHVQDEEERDQRGVEIVQDGEKFLTRW
jgi:hypothetical protein